MSRCTQARGSAPFGHVVLALMVMVATGCGSVQAVPPDGATIGDDAAPPADGPRLTLALGAPALAEGAQGTLAVGLSAPAATGTVIALTASVGAAVQLVPSTVELAPGETGPIAVTVVGNTDDDAEDVAVELAATAPGVAGASVALTIDDDDVLAIAATPGAAIEVSEGGTAAVLVRLTAQPVAPVNVTASTSAPAVSATPAQLVFTPSSWSTPQAVTVTGAQDADTANAAASLQLAATSLPAVAVAVSVIDDDVLGIAPSAAALSIAEGGSSSFMVALTQQPSANVVVTVTSPDGGAVAAAASLTFTPTTWNVPQAVAVQAPQDADTRDEAVPVALAASGLALRTVSVTVDDDDTQRLVVDPAPGTIAIAEGQARTVRVQLAAEPDAAVAVTVTSSDPAIATTSLAAITFGVANYASPRQVNVTAVADPDTLLESTAVVVTAPGLTPVVYTVEVVEPPLDCASVGSPAGFTRNELFPRGLHDPEYAFVLFPTQDGPGTSCASFPGGSRPCVLAPHRDGAMAIAVQHTPGSPFRGLRWDASQYTSPIYGPAAGDFYVTLSTCPFDFRDRAGRSTAPGPHDPTFHRGCSNLKASAGGDLLGVSIDYNLDAVTIPSYCTLESGRTYYLNLIPASPAGGFSVGEGCFNAGYDRCGIQARGT